jgi:FAD/FMN-containing dehydrogenases
MTLSHTIASADQLRKQIAGIVLTPNDPDYEQKRRAWDLTLEQHPALILIPQNAEDVVAGVRFARDAGMGIAIQSTGHGTLYPADDNLLIITSQMNAVEVNVQARTARVEAGTVWKHVLDKSTPHGLAPLLGTSPHVGVVGYTTWARDRLALAQIRIRGG